MLFLSVQEAINLLEPMTNDPVNYVRQGALISSALIMVQQSEVTCPKVGKVYYIYSEMCLFFYTVDQFQPKRI